MPKFAPEPHERTVKRNIRIELAPDDYDRLKALAARHKVSLKEFVKQAVAFAVANMK